MSILCSWTGSWYSWSNYFISNRVISSRGQHGIGTVPENFQFPRSANLSPGPGFFNFESRSRILQFWVPVPNPGFSDFASRSDFRDQDCGIPGTLSRMLTPDFKSTCCRSGSMGSKAGLISCALGSFSIGGGTYSDICLKKIQRRFKWLAGKFEVAENR